MAEEEILDESKDGDFFWDEETGFVYRKKEGVWGLPIATVETEGLLHALIRELTNE